MLSADEGKAALAIAVSFYPDGAVLHHDPASGSAVREIVFLFWGVRVFMLPITIIDTLAV